MTRFPLATGQRGGNRDRALRTRCMWNGGWKSTQSSQPASSLVADKTLAMRWSRWRYHRRRKTFNTSKTDGSGEPEERSTGGALEGVPLFCRLAGGAAGGDKGWGGTALGVTEPGEGVGRSDEEGVEATGREPSREALRASNLASSEAEVSKDI